MTTPITLPPWLAPLIEMFVLISKHPDFVSYERITRQVGIGIRGMERFRPSLVECGLIIAMRGPNGGVKLARPAYSITVGDIYRASRKAAMLKSKTDNEGWLDRREWPKSESGKHLQRELRVLEDKIVKEMDRVTIEYLAEAMEDYERIAADAR